MAGSPRSGRVIRYGLPHWLDRRGEWMGSGPANRAYKLRCKRPLGYCRILRDADVVGSDPRFTKNPRLEPSVWESYSRILVGSPATRTEHRPLAAELGMYRRQSRNCGNSGPCGVCRHASSGIEASLRSQDSVCCGNKRTVAATTRSISMPRSRCSASSEPRSSKATWLSVRWRCECICMEIICVLYLPL